MEIVAKTIAVESIIVAYFSDLKIENIMKIANVETHVIGQVKIVILLFVAVIGVLSGCILFSK